MYRPNGSSHDAFLEYPTSGTLKVKRLYSNIEMYNTINVVFFQYYNIVWFAIDHFLSPNSVRNWSRRVRMVVGFTTTCANSAYHH